MKNEGKLSHEESEILKRLYKEVVTRITEASSIIGRSLGKEHFTIGALGIAINTPIIEAPKILPVRQNPIRKEEYIKVLCAEGFCILDDKGHCVGVYNEKEGVCKPC